MMVEFMGCTGAGKTTLARATARQLRAGGHALIDFALTGSSIGSSLGNVARAMRRAPGVAWRWRQHSGFGACLEAGIRAQSSSAAWSLARRMAAVRRIGDHAARAADARLCITDEGIGAAIHLAVAGPVATPPAELDALADSMPLPDLIVMVDAPPEAIVARTRARPDAPREMRRLDPDELARWTGHIVAAYRQLADHARVRPRTLRAWNEGQDVDAQAAALAGTIASAFQSR